MDGICNGVCNLSLHNPANDRFEDRFDKPSHPRKFTFAELILDFMDMDSDSFQREDFLEAFFPDFDIEGNIHAAFVKLEGSDSLVSEVEDPAVGTKPEADFVGADREAVDGDGEEGGGGCGGAEGVGFADFEIVVGFDAEFVWEEGGLIYGAAGFDDEVFEEKIDFRDGDFHAGDGYVLDAVDGVLD